MGFRRQAVARRAERALERQLDYQRKKAVRLAGQEQQCVADMLRASQGARARLEAVRPIAADARVLEVGSGAHGLIFFFGAEQGIGLDPLADHYRTLFPAWQGRVRTVAAGGEKLPFADASFDVVLCDNVVDHAEDPWGIVAEIARVLAPGGLFYFAVNVHHPFYHLAASAHAGWRALGVPFEITPFADHTVHLTPAAARAMLRNAPFRLVSEEDDVAEVRRVSGSIRIRHFGDRLKRLFYKNASYRAVAIREGEEGAQLELGVPRKARRG